MEVNKQEFETTKGLLEDVMTKQAGTLEKAVLEGVMNSVDADASQVHITIEEDHLIIEDDGRGMSESEVEEYFQKFGLKDDDIEDKEFGKFRMGRGQIFSFGRNVWHTGNLLLVVDLDNDKTTLTADGEEHTLDVSGLSYNTIEIGDQYNGCSISVDLYEEIDDVESKVNDVEKLIKYIPWLHGVEVTINGEDIDHDFDPDYETESAYIEFKPNSIRTSSLIYNKGAKVKTERLVPTRAVLVTKDDLDLNFARNDVLSGCPVYARVREELDEVYTTYLKQKDELTTDEVNWLVERMGKDDGLMKAMYSEPLIQTATGDTVSMSEISDNPVVLNKGSQSMAEDIQRRTGAIPLDEGHREIFESDNVFTEKKDYTEVIGQEMTYEMDPYSESKLTKSRRKNLYRLKWALNEITPFMEVESGVSKHREVWMVDDSTVFVDKDFLKAKKTKFATHVLPQVLKHSRFKCDTRTDVQESGMFHRRVTDMMDDLASIQLKVLEGHPDVEGYVDAEMN